MGAKLLNRLKRHFNLDDMDEFLEEHEWHCQLVDENKNTVLVTGSFAYVEWAYFEGFNMPMKIIDGKREPFDVAHDRMSRWYKIPSDERRKFLKTINS